jgi:hypothetical protein
MVGVACVLLVCIINAPPTTLSCDYKFYRVGSNIPRRGVIIHPSDRFVPSSTNTGKGGRCFVNHELFVLNPAPIKVGGMVLC